MSALTQGTLPTEGALPELESVYWRPRVSDSVAAAHRADLDGDHRRAHGAVRRGRRAAAACSIP